MSGMRDRFAARTNIIPPFCCGDSSSSLTYIYIYISAERSAAGFAVAASPSLEVTKNTNRTNKEIPNQKVNF